MYEQSLFRVLENAMLLLLLFAVAWRIKKWSVTLFVWAILLGITGNQTVVLLNDGRMPVFLEKETEESRYYLQKSATHQIGTPETQLKQLSDVYNIQVHNETHVLSAGDLVMLLTPCVLLCFCAVYSCVRGRKYFLHDYTKKDFLLYTAVICTVYISVFLRIR
jgi:hypothetical protein